MVEDGAVGQQSAVFEAYRGNEESDASRYAVFQCGRQHLKDNLPHVAHADAYEQQTLDEHCRQGELPGIAQRQAYRTDKESVERQSGSLSKGSLGDEGHEQRAHDGTQCGDCKDGLHGESFAAQRGKHYWHQGEDIDHRNKGGETRENLGLQAVSLEGEAQKRKNLFFHTCEVMGIMRSNLEPP